MQNGGRGADTFVGGEGKDLHQAGAADRLVDVFVFNSVGESQITAAARNCDVIMGFEVGYDRIDLSALKGSDGEALEWSTGPAANSVWVVYQGNGRATLYANVNGSGQPSFGIEFAGATGSPTEADILLG